MRGESYRTTWQHPPTQIPSEQAVPSFRTLHTLESQPATGGSAIIGDGTRQSIYGVNSAPELVS